MAQLTVTPVTKAGLPNYKTGTVTADVAGDSVASASGLLIVMGNTDTAAHTLTIAAPVATASCGNYGDLPVTPITLAVAQDEVGFLTVPLGYSDTSGNFAWTYDAVTGVTIGVYSLSP